MTYKFRYAIQFIIEDPDYSGSDLGKSFIEEVEDLDEEEKEKDRIILDNIKSSIEKN